MAITSVQIGPSGSLLEIENSVVYAVAQETALALLGTDPYEAVTVDLAGAPPYFVRNQIMQRPVPLGVFLLGTTYPARKTAYDALVAKLDPTGLVELRWTDSGVIRYLTVSAGPVLAAAWLQRMTCELTAWDPRPVTV